MAVTVGNIGNNAVITSTDLDAIFTSYGNEINRVAGLVDAATAAPGATSKILKTDASGSIVLAGSFAAAGSLAASSSGVAVTGALTVSTTFQTVGAATLSGGLTVNGGGGINVTGSGNNINTAAAMSVGTSLGVGGAATVGGLLTAASVSFPRGAIPLSFLSSFTLTQATPGNLTVTVGTGDFETASADPQTYPGGGSLTFVSTASQQFIGVYVTDALALGQTTPAASLATVAFPASGAKPLYVFSLPANATGVVVSNTNPGGTVGYIAWDGRMGGAGGGSGGGGTGAPASALFWISGTNGSLINALDSTSAVPDTSYMHPAQVRDGATSANMADAIREYVSATVLASLTVSGAASVQLDASSGPLFINHAGRSAIVSTGVIASSAIPNAAAAASGAAGIRYVIADLSAPPGFTIGIAGNGGSFPTLGAFQRVIAALVWDGATLYLDRTQLSPADGAWTGGIVDSTQFAPNSFYQTWTGAAITANAGAYATLAGISLQYVNFPVPMIGQVEFEATFTQTGTVQTANIEMLMDNNPIGAKLYFDDVPASKLSTRGQKWRYTRAAPLPAGRHWFTPVIITQTGGAGGLGLTDVQFAGIFYRA